MRRDALAVLALAGLAVGLTWGTWGHPPQWKPDALFYESQLLEVQGTGAATARARVFGGPLAAPRRAGERSLPAAERKVASRNWVDYSSRFYRRRWTVPILGAAIEPVAGADALQLVSLVGMVLVGPLLYLLLRLRFDPWAAAAAAAACVALPPLRYWAEMPQTDSTAVAVEVLALLAGMLALAGRRLRLLPWAAAMLVLAFTRDSAVVVAVGAIWLALRAGSRRTAALALTGAAAALLPAVFFGAPLRESIAYTLNDFRPPANPSWGFVAHHYATGVHSVEEHDASYLLDHPLTAVVALAAVASLVLVRRRDPYFTLVRAVGVACGLYVLVLPNYTAFRLELVFLPVVAVGFALGLSAAAPPLERLLERRGLSFRRA